MRLFFTIIFWLLMGLGSFATGYFLIDQRILGYSEGKNLSGFSLKAELLETSASGKINKNPFVDRAVVSPMFKDNALYYFDKFSGKIFYKKDVHDKEQVLVDRLIFEIVKATWSPSGGLYTITRNTGSFKISEVYRAGELLALFRSVGVVAISSNETSLAYVLALENEDTIYLRSLTDSSEKSFFKTRLKVLDLYWIDNSSLLAILQTGEFFEIVRLGINGEIKNLVKTKSEPGPILSDSKEEFLYTDQDQFGAPELKYFDLKNLSTFSLGVQTRSNKCAWASGHQFFCGLAENISLFDSIYLLETTGLKKELYKNIDNLIVKEMTFDPKENRLAIINALDDRVFLLSADFNLN